MHEKYTTDRDGHWDGEVTCPDTHKVGDSTGETTSDGIELVYCEQCGREISGELNDYPDYLDTQEEQQQENEKPSNNQ